MKRKSKGEIRPDSSIAGEDPTRLISEHTLGKRGGSFELPFGGKLIVPSGLFSKKEVFLIATTAKKIKQPLNFKLPVVLPKSDFLCVKLMMRPMNSAVWNKVDCVIEADDEGDGRVDFETANGGIYVALSTPKSEHFPIPSQGYLHNAKLCHQISIRAPKGATPTDIEAFLYVIPLNVENLEAVRLEHPKETADLLSASNFFNIEPSDVQFKRALTVKLPLPGDIDENDKDDLCILQWSEDGVEQGCWHWKWHKTNYRFSRNTVQFDTKRLGMFCIAKSKPGRLQRLKEAVRYITPSLNATYRGDIVVTVQLRTKSWSLWVDIAHQSNLEAVRQSRLSVGFLNAIEKEDSDIAEQAPVKATSYRSLGRRRKFQQEEEDTELENLTLQDGVSYSLKISGDVRVRKEQPSTNTAITVNSIGTASNDSDDLNVYTYPNLDRSYRKISIEPDSQIEAGKPAAFTVACVCNSSKAIVRTFKFEINSQAVEDYLAPEPEPEVEEEEVEPPKPETPPPPPPPKPQPKEDRKISSSFVRLTTPKRRVEPIVREAKVLSGKSLRILAREIQNGLTLAIYLDLSDSSITGMGFDAIATGATLSDITYRILLMWKRATSTKMKSRQVDLLCAALSEMGRPDLSAVLHECHETNSELTEAAFHVNDMRNTPASYV
ncbi:DgyrCDS112 [Dimorphilus gyrociliatus]|uniref:DgyrCDS112 n=1 Tax=Dimorphilus gyrociliatus TaxID=2664684 RepID=A0A7I8V3M4_9ANNE|nr:DgyrCDS112 [Dimorphilus gyrociliatus]